MGGFLEVIQEKSLLRRGLKTLRKRQNSREPLEQVFLEPVQLWSCQGKPTISPGNSGRKGRGRLFIQQSSNLAKALNTARLGDLPKAMKPASWEGRGWDQILGSVAPGSMLLTSMLHGKMNFLNSSIGEKWWLRVLDPDFLPRVVELLLCFLHVQHVGETQQACSEGRFFSLQSRFLPVECHQSEQAGGKFK